MNKEYNKIRVLAIERMLSKNLISTRQIIDRLEREYDIIADRRTVYSDMLAIDRFIPIEFVPGKHAGYRIMDV